MNNTNDTKHAEQNARSHLAGILALYRLSVWDDGDVAQTIAELRTAKKEHTINDEQRELLAEWEAALVTAGLRDVPLDELDDAIHDHLYNLPLEVRYRSGWTSDGRPLEKENALILLSTGGPACRVIGGDNEQHRIEYQDWSTPWTALTATSDERAALIWFVEQFEA